MKVQEITIPMKKSSMTTPMINKSVVEEKLKARMQDEAKMRLSFYLCAVVLLLMTVILLTLRATLFSGISAKEIDYVVDKGQIPYTVTGFHTTTDENGIKTYDVTLTGGAVDAPVITQVGLKEVPADMSINASYLADWVHIAAVYDTYAKTKDLIALEYTGAIITEEKIEETKVELCNRIMSMMSKYTQPSFTWFALGVFAISVILISLGNKVMGKLAKSIAVPNVWDIQEAQLKAIANSTTHNGVVLNCNEIFGKSLNAVPYPAINCRFWADDADYNLYIERKKRFDELRNINAKNDLSTVGVTAQRVETPVLASQIPSFDINTGATVTATKPINKGSNNPMANRAKANPMLKSSNSMGVRKVNSANLSKFKKVEPVATAHSSLQNLDIDINSAKAYAESQAVPLMSTIKK